MGNARPGLPVLHTSVEGTVAAPTSDVWALVRDFEGWGRWWPRLTTSLVDPTGVEPLVAGQVRLVSANGRSYKEKLIKIDDDNMTLEYELVSSKGAAAVALPVTAKTTVEVCAGRDKATSRMVWSCAFQTDVPEGGVAIRKGQEVAYTEGIEAIKKEVGDGAPPHEPVQVSVAMGASVDAALTPVGTLTLSVGGACLATLRLSPGGAVLGGREGLTLHLAPDDGDLTVELVDPEGGALATGTLPAAALLGAQDKESEEGLVHKVTLSSSTSSAVACYLLSVETPPPASPAEALSQLLLAMGQELLGQITATAFRIGSDDGALTWAYASYPSASAETPLPKYCASLPPSEAIPPARTGFLFGRSTEFLYAQVRLLQLVVDTSPQGGLDEATRLRMAASAAAIKKEIAADPWSAPFFGSITKPLVADNWKDDGEVAEQFIRGVNPMKIVRVTGDPTAALPSVFHSLTDPDGRGLGALVACKSLFYADYSELALGEEDEASGAFTHAAFSSVLDSPVGARKYWYAPRVVLYKTPGGKLSLLGFTLTRKGDGTEDEVYTASTHAPMVYLLAKAHMTCADNQAHQFVSHLGMTHLLAEPFIVATHNALPSTHVVARLLVPHFADTIGINFLARQTLVSTVAPLTDATFSAGTANGMDVFSAAYQGWDFLGSNFVNGLAARGFSLSGAEDELDGFYYRDDGVKVWNAFIRHVSAVLTAAYGPDGDAAVAADADLALWVEEMRSPDKAAVTSFPASFGSVKALTEALVTIIFMCSAQHAAVNFSQEEYVTYVPNRPDSMRVPMPPTPPAGEDLPPTALAAAFPTAGVSLFQTFFGYLLSSPTQAPATSIEAQSALREEFPAEVGALAADLRRIQADIKERNDKLVAIGQAPYVYLSPENMPLSIDI